MRDSEVYVITGGGSGMGRLAATRYAAQGHKVAILDVNEHGMAETAIESENISIFNCDITDFKQLSTVVNEITTGLGPIYRLINCAAIMPFGKLTEQDEKLQKKIMDINWCGLVNLTRAALPGMLAQGRGEFVSFASMAGIVPILLTGAYSASKAAVITYTETLMHENINSGVKFFCVCPTTVATPLLNQARETAWPKMLDSTDNYLEPREVLDAVDRGIEKGEFMIYPTKEAKMGARMRRLVPGLLWKQVHKVEGW